MELRNKSCSSKSSKTEPMFDQTGVRRLKNVIGLLLCDFGVIQWWSGKAGKVGVHYDRKEMLVGSVVTGSIPDSTKLALEVTLVSYE